jgi:hypothetical protein
VSVSNRIVISVAVLADAKGNEACVATLKGRD